MRKAFQSLTANEDESSLLRYLNATRQDCRVVNGTEAEAARFVAGLAFPAIDFDCALAAIRSKGRRCEYRTIGNSAFVVMDLELSNRMKELDLLVQLPAMKANWVYTFFVMLLADAFRQQNDLRRYRYCVLKVRGDTESIRGLSSLPKDGPLIHIEISQVLLHELAHIAFRRGDAFVRDLRALARATLEKFADHSEEQAKTGQSPISGGVTLGVPMEAYDQARLKRQLDLYVSTIRGNEELEEELTCDVISALAMVNFEGRMDCFRDLVPVAMPLSIRQLGDIYYLAVKTSRYLQILSAIPQFAANVKAGVDDLDRNIIEMTARTNALTDLLLNLFQAQIERGDFRDKPDFGRPLSRHRIQAVMHISMERLMRYHHERLLGPFEELTGFFVDNEAFDRDNDIVLKASSGRLAETIEMVDELRAEIPF